MSKFLKIFLTFIAIWAVASLTNGVLCGICIAISNRHISSVPEVSVLAIIFSFIFSVPLVGLTWLVTCIAQSLDKNGFALFQIVLATAIICSSIGALLFINTLGYEFQDCNYALGFCIIISAASSVLLFRKKIKTNG